MGNLQSVPGSVARRVAVVAAGMLAATALVATPAQASKDGICNSGDMCAWQDSGYSGGFLDYFYADNDFRNDVFFVTGAIVDNRITSIKNQDPSCQANFYRGPGYVDGGWYLAHGNSTSNLIFYSANDIFSSFDWSNC